MTKGNENASEEIMAENAPNLKEEIDIQVQAAQRVPNKINPDRRALEQATVKTAHAHMCHRAAHTHTLTHTHTQ